MKKIFSVISLIFLVIQGIIAQNVGEPAPDFSFNDYNDNEFKLSDHSGKVVFIFTFGNSCPSCLGFGNETETKINDVYGGREDFVAVGADFWNSSSSNTSVSVFAEQTGIEYPLLVKAGDMADLYNTTYDRLLVIDKEGILRHKGNTVGSADIDNAITVIDEYLMPLTVNSAEIDEPNVTEYPIPAINEVTLSFRLGNRSDITIDIYNTLGKQVLKGFEGVLPAGPNEITIKTSGLTNGFYFYTIKGKEFGSYSGKILIKNY